MSSDLTGIPTRTGRPITSNGGPTPASPSTPAASRALTRVGPSGAATGTCASAIETAAIANPLDRSGLSLFDVLGTSDVHVVRDAAAPVALEVGLETARSALLRQQPVDALAALDSVWEGARQTEDGWYLRGGALLVLGLPGEGDRVAEEGIVTRPASTALRFLQSLARLTLGDLHGARTTLGLALQRLPSDRLLLAQQAVLLARAGDDDHADAAMRAASKRAAPDDPILAYGHAAMRAASVERRRSEAGIDVPDAAAVDAELDPAGADGGASPLVADTEGDEASDMMPDRATAAAGADGRIPPARDPVFAAVQSLGTRLAASDPDALLREVRLLMRALSAGGTLANSAGPELSHAARGILSVMLDVLDTFGEPHPPQGSTDGPDAPAYASLVRDVVNAARSGDPDGAMRALRRQPAIARESVGALLQSMMRGALHRRAADGVGTEWMDRAKNAANDAAHEAAHEVVQEEQGGPIIPVRLGLRLIDESAASRAMLRVSTEAGAETRLLLSSGGSGLAAAIAAARSSVRWDAGATPSDARDAGREAGRDVARDSGRDSARDGVHGPVAMTAPRVSGVRDGVNATDVVDAADGAITSGWLAGTAAPTGRGDVRMDEDESLSHGRGVRVLAMLCVIVAAAAAASGYTIVAVAFGVGASWFAVRRSGGRSEAGAHSEQTGSRSSGERRH